jgi:hypothetical protein
MPATISLRPGVIAGLGMRSSEYDVSAMCRPSGASVQCWAARLDRISGLSYLQLYFLSALVFVSVSIGLSNGVLVVSRVGAIAGRGGCPAPGE